MAKKDLEIRVVKLEDGRDAIMSKLTEMNGTLTGIDHVIRGNGAPGLVTNVEKQDLRIKELEKARKSWKDLMVLIISGGLVAFIAEMLHHFVGR